VIGQLESEERERKLAWEKESRLNVDNQVLSDDNTFSVIF